MNTVPNFCSLLARDAMLKSNGPAVNLASVPNVELVLSYSDGMIEPDLTNERLRSSPAAHSQPDRLQSVRDGLARWAFVCSACCAAIVLAAGWRSDDQTSKAPRSAAWVEKRFADWQPTREERAFEDIDWAPSLSEAESLARKHARAIFLFTYDGADLAGYRC